MDLFEAECFFEGDAAGFGVGDEAEVSDEEDLLFEDVFGLDALEFGGERGCDGETEIRGERGGAYGGAIVELNVVRVR